MPRIQGIYIITNIGTADTYIGSSININERWSDHLWHLKNNRHKNALLQSDYNKDGVNAFAAATLELVEQIEQLAVREQYHLDSLRPSYNQGKIAARAPYRTWRSDEADRKRFWSKVDQTAEGCWLWQGTMLQQGYGCFKIAGKMYKAHRVAYLYAVDSIPEGLVLFLKGLFYATLVMFAIVSAPATSLLAHIRTTAMMLLAKEGKRRESGMDHGFILRR